MLNNKRKCVIHEIILPWLTNTYAELQQLNSHMIRERTKKIPLTDKIENFGCHFQTGCMIVVPHEAFLLHISHNKPCLPPPSQPPKIAY